MRKTNQRRGTYGPGGDAAPSPPPEREPGGDIPATSPRHVLARNTLLGPVSGLIGTTPERERQVRELNHLEDAFAMALAVVWNRIQAGQFRDNNQAKALVDARVHLLRAQELTQVNMRQLPLPETSAAGEKDYPVALTPAVRAYADSLAKSDVAVREGSDRKCRICGCTNDHACGSATGPPCSWVESDLCSGCVGKRPADPFDALGPGLPRLEARDGTAKQT